MCSRKQQLDLVVSGQRTSHAPMEFGPRPLVAGTRRRIVVAGPEWRPGPELPLTRGVPREV